MRVRLIIENGGRAVSKFVDLPEVPSVGALVQADRTRRVVGVELAAEHGEHAIYLAEDATDLAVYIQPAAHLARLDAMKADGWEVEDEDALRAWLRERLGQPGRPGAVERA
ncbi:hypothetical protein BE21_02520 [Sorangium cellulosum]|uniref:Uncharacterized protein n=1 Tax=Sorangium cellulosum TaxID=56 RepID=A0A150TSI1_SORCE|nr:hypothetical protein BE21_02520 [Sorangium cellulosum]